MTEDEIAAKELYEAKRQYSDAEGMLAIATARLNAAERTCKAIWDRRIRPVVPPPAKLKQWDDHRW